MKPTFKKWHQNYYLESGIRYNTPQGSYPMCDIPANKIISDCNCFATKQHIPSGDKTVECCQYCFDGKNFDDMCRYSFQQKQNEKK